MDLGNYMRFFAALVFVLALIGLATWLARKFGFGIRSAPVRRGDRRLHVVEVATVGSKHRAVLLRRDDKEHLVILGGATDVVVETGIAAPPESSVTAPAPKSAAGG